MKLGFGDCFFQVWWFGVSNDELGDVQDVFNDIFAGGVVDCL